MPWHEERVSFYSPDGSKDKQKKKLMCILHPFLQVLQMSVLDVEIHLQCHAQDSWLTATASAGDGKPSASVKEAGNLPLLKCSSNPTRNGP